MENLANKMLDEAEALAELNKGADTKIEDIKSKYSAANDNIEAELAALKAGLNQ
jgi:phage shock protein A